MRAYSIDKCLWAWMYLIGDKTRTLLGIIKAGELINELIELISKVIFATFQLRMSIFAREFKIEILRIK